MLRLPVPLVPHLAAIELRFDPDLQVGALTVSWQALALSAVIGLALMLFVVALRHRVGPVPAADVAFVVLAAIPGAVVGGRLVHGLVYWDAYALDPTGLLDLGHGSLSLAGAVVGGSLTAGYVVTRLGRPVGAWADAAAVPLLVAIGGGKVAMLLGGAGQGVAWAGRGAIAFLGDGPWGSVDPARPAYPAQLLEGAWALVGAAVVTWLGRRLDRADQGDRGLWLLAAAAWWLAGRAAFAAWWRDQPMLGPWGREGLVALILAIGCLAWLAVLGRRQPPPRSSRSRPGSAVRS